MANIIDKAIRTERGKSKEKEKKEERGAKKTKRVHRKQDCENCSDQVYGNERMEERRKALGWRGLG